MKHLLDHRFVWIIPLTILAGCGRVTVDAGADQAVQEGTSVTLSAFGGSTAQQGAAHFVWIQVSGTEVALANPNEQDVTFTAPLVSESETLTFQVTVTAQISDFLSSAQDTVEVTVLPNPAVLANAGVDQTVTEGQFVSLPGSATFDVEGITLTYHWTQINQPLVNLSNADTATAGFTAPMVDEATTLEFQLAVTAEQDNVGTDTVVITVEPEKPIARAGADQEVTETVRVDLDGSASTDPDGGVLSYLWTQLVLVEGTEVELLPAATTAKPYFIAPEIDDPTLLRFQLTVIAEDGVNNDFDTVDITVNPYPAPVADAGNDVNADEGDVVTLDGTGSSDPIGGTLTYLWTAPQGITLSDDQVPKPVFTAPAVGAHTVYVFTLTVTNNHGESATDSVNITVLNVP